MNEKQQKNLQINKEIKEWIPTWNLSWNWNYHENKHYIAEIWMEIYSLKKLHFLKIQDAKNRELSTQGKILSR